MSLLVSTNGPSWDLDHFPLIWIKLNELSRYLTRGTKLYAVTEHICVLKYGWKPEQWFEQYWKITIKDEIDFKKQNYCNLCGTKKRIDHFYNFHLSIMDGDDTERQSTEKICVGY